MSEMVLKRDVVFAGENPLLMLYAPGTEDIVAVASYWRCSYSAQGEGQALVIWVNAEASGLGEQAPIGIYTDNVEMARMVWEEFNRHFEPLQNRGIEEREPETARFVQQPNGLRLHRVACSVGATTIELVWRDAMDIFQEVTTPTVGDSRWEVSSMICPCADAGISVNGTKVDGEVRRLEGTSGGSAFLAFCESWVRLG